MDCSVRNNMLLHTTRLLKADEERHVFVSVYVQTHSGKMCGHFLHYAVNQGVDPSDTNRTLITKRPLEK